MKIVTGCPSARPMAAKEMPVLPLVPRRSPARLQLAASRVAQDVERHPVLDAAGEVEALCLGVDQARGAAVDRELDREERGVADEDTKSPEPVSEGHAAHAALLAGSRGRHPPWILSGWWRHRTAGS
jgi:hypothetical protein